MLTLNVSVELGQSLVCLVPLLGLQTGLPVNKGEDRRHHWTALLRGSDLSPYDFLLDEKL